MSDHTKRDQQEELKAHDESRALSTEEIEQEQAAELPDREAMSLVNANLAAPINLSAALNVLSDNSTAYSNAEQVAPIGQSTAPTVQAPGT